MKELTFTLGFSRRSGAPVSVCVPARFAERRSLMTFSSFAAAFAALEDGEITRPDQPLTLGERLLRARRNRRSHAAFLRREAEARALINPQDADDAARELLTPELLTLIGLEQV